MTKAIEFAELGKLCEQIESTHERGDYRQSFGWIEALSAVTDHDTVKRLEEILLASLRSGSTECLDLAVPEVADWERVSGFSYSTDQGRVQQDLCLADYLGSLLALRRLDRLSVRQMRQHKVHAVDGDDQVVGTWPAYRCLSGEVKLGGETFLVSDGQFFRVSKDYRDALDRFVHGIAETALELPSSWTGEAEQNWNERAARHSPGERLVMDRKTVRVASSTSPVEVCDILTRDGAFIHVKRKIASSDLSHLFAQGAVAGDLLLMSREFREAALEKIAQAEAECEASLGMVPDGRFAVFGADSFTAGRFRVVYAIIANWRGKTLTEALPFFSKVNLRRHVQSLRRSGYTVECARVQEEPQT